MAIMDTEVGQLTLSLFRLEGSIGSPFSAVGDVTRKEPTLDVLDHKEYVQRIPMIGKYRTVRPVEREDRYMGAVNPEVSEDKFRGVVLPASYKGMRVRYVDGLVRERNAMGYAADDEILIDKAYSTSDQAVLNRLLEHEYLHIVHPDAPHWLIEDMTMQYLERNDIASWYHAIDLNARRLDLMRKRIGDPEEDKIAEGLLAFSEYASLIKARAEEMAIAA